jgi:hypothetical protein
LRNIRLHMNKTERSNFEILTLVEIYMYVVRDCIVRIHTPWGQKRKAENATFDSVGIVSYPQHPCQIIT